MATSKFLDLPSGIRDQQLIMIRPATASDSGPIAKALWDNWHHLKARQLGTVPREYPSPDALAEKIRGELDRWLVCDSKDPKEISFFSTSPLGTDKTFKKWRFPEGAIRVEHFACLLRGEVLLEHLQLLAAHFENDSILLCIPSALRDAYWAALKAGFKLLGESPLIVGTFAWLYLDRAARFEEIQAKLRRAKIIAA